MKYCVPGRNLNVVRDVTQTYFTTIYMNEHALLGKKLLKMHNALFIVNFTIAYPFIYLKTFTFWRKLQRGYNIDSSSPLLYSSFRFCYSLETALSSVDNPFLAIVKDQITHVDFIRS